MAQKVPIAGPTTLIRGIPILDSFIESWEDIHGGKILKDDRISWVLQQLCNRYKIEHGIFPDLLRPPEFPLEQYYPVEIYKNYPLIKDPLPTGILVFIVCPRMFVVPGGTKRA